MFHFVGSKHGQYRAHVLYFELSGFPGFRRHSNSTFRIKEACSFVSLLRPGTWAILSSKILLRAFWFPRLQSRIKFILQTKESLLLCFTSSTQNMGNIELMSSISSFLVSPVSVATQIRHSE